MTNPDGLDEKGLTSALEAFNQSINNPQMVPCPKCEGRGYHHGFGEDGASPDWCIECGGNQFNVVPGEEERAMSAAIRAYLSALPSPAGELEVVALIQQAIDQEAAEYEADAPEAIERGERPDLWDREITIPSAWAVGALSLISTLRGERDEALALVNYAEDVSKAAIAQTYAAEQQVQRLREALAPFAEAADNLDDQHPDGSPIWETPAAMGIDAKHLRAARSALSNQEGGDE